MKALLRGFQSTSYVVVIQIDPMWHCSCSLIGMKLQHPTSVPIGRTFGNVGCSNEIIFKTSSTVLQVKINNFSYIMLQWQWAKWKIFRLSDEGGKIISCGALYGVRPYHVVEMMILDHIILQTTHYNRFIVYSAIITQNFYMRSELDGKLYPWGSATTGP